MAPGQRAGHPRPAGQAEEERIAERSPRMGRKPSIWTAVDRDYEQIRIDMQTLFSDLGLSTVATAATAA
jgi:hypothetical protein